MLLISLPDFSTSLNAPSSTKRQRLMQNFRSLHFLIFYLNLTSKTCSRNTNRSGIISPIQHLVYLAATM